MWPPAVLLLLAVLTAALASTAGATHSVTTLLSVGPTGGNDAFTAFYVGASDDGSHVFFQTNEKLTSADTDGRIDVYERSGGATTLVSTGPSGGNGGFDAFFSGSSADGTRVFFGTREKLTGVDGDSSNDVYERSGGTTTLLSTGPSGGNGATGAFFDGASGDGARVFFHTAEKLVTLDLDTETDVYQRSGSATTLISTGVVGGNAEFPASFDGSSADGTHIFFDTQEPLEASDTDAAFDVYDRFGGATSQVSTGSAGGNGPSDAFFDGSSADGSHVFFTTDEPLELGDTDSSFDVYDRAGGASSRVSTSSSGGNGANDSLFVGASEDGSRVFFESDESLAPGDFDGQVDVYERAGGATTRLSTGTAGGNGSFDARFAGASRDGADVFFETDEILTTDDSDGQVDVYEHAGGATGLVSTGPAGGNGLFDADFRGASASGNRVFFQTAEALVSGDADSAVDLYERHAGSTTAVSVGPGGGNGAFDAAFVGRSRDGERVFYSTQERLVAADGDSSQDVYGATVATYGAPATAPTLSISLTPTFKQCGTGARTINAAHAPPLATASCGSPAPTAAVARVGGQATGSVSMTVVPGDLTTVADEADIAVAVNASDVRAGSVAGSDYAPNPSGPDLRAIVRVRLTDYDNGVSLSDSATASDIDLAIPVDCAQTPDTAVGATCTANTTLEAVTPGAIAEGKRTVVQTFRVRLTDAGANGTVGDSDDTLFEQQGVFLP